MWIAWMIFTVAAIAAIIIGIAFLFNVWRMTQIPFRHCSFSFIDRNAIPEEESSRLAGAEEFLLSEGFVYSCSAHLPQTQLDLPGLNEIYLNVYHHAESDVYATVSWQKALARCSIMYLSCFSDGTYWQTYNKIRHYIPEFYAPLLMGKRDKKAQTEEEAARMVFEALSHPGFARLSLNKRIELADVLVTERMERQPDGREILLGGLVYLLCLALTVLYAIDIMFRDAFYTKI